MIGPDRTGRDRPTDGVVTDAGVGTDVSGSAGITG